MRLPISLILCSISLAAQSQYFSFGLTGGGAFGRGTGSIPFGPDESRRYTFGLTFETFFTEHISVAGNALYRRTGASYGIVPGAAVPILELGNVVETSGTVRTHSLELPVTGRYTFRRASSTVRPFAGAGFAFQTGWETDHNHVVLSNPAQVYDVTTTTRSPFDVGAVFNAGAVLRYKRLHYVPEMRFTRWGNGTLTHVRSQFEALFTVRF